MKVAVLINSKANQTQQLDPDQIQGIAKKFGLDCTFFIKPPSEIDQTLKTILQQDHQILLVAGGDGTVRAAAQLLYDSEKILAVLPTGTCNNFAKTLELPADISDIMALIKNKKIKKIDVAQVNDLIFVNNCSIGLYPKILKDREKYLDLFSRSKLWKKFLTIINFFSSLPVYNVRLSIEGKETVSSSFLVFVGNNYYSLDREDFGERESLRQGELSVYALRCRNKLGFLILFMKIMLGRKNIEHDLFQYTTTKSFSIETRKSKINVALDGEIFQIKTPLMFNINKKFLSVVAP